MLKPVIAYIDGGARGNPGPAGYGVCVETVDGHTIDELRGTIGIATNNSAEYHALIAALQYLVEKNYLFAVIRSDSQLLTRQMRGDYRVKHPELQKLYNKAISLAKQLTDVEYTHIPREQNQRADRLANLAMDSITTPDKSRPGETVETMRDQIAAIHGIEQTAQSAETVLAVGIDIEEVSRVDELMRRYGDRFINRVFTDAEAAYCQSRRFPASHLAARFSAKEATMKALGTGRSKGVLWKDIEVVRKDGPPHLVLRGGAKQQFIRIGAVKSLLSLSHTRTLSVAQVVVIGN